MNMQGHDKCPGAKSNIDKIKKGGYGKIMNKQQKAVSKLLSFTLANISVIGFGLAIYENRHLALLAGILAICTALLIEWRSEE